MKFSKLCAALSALFISTVATVVPAQTITSPNNVYIEQLGNSNTIKIDQIGGSNRVGGLASTTPSNTNYALVSGNNNSLTISQFNTNNLSQYTIYGHQNVYTSTIDGVSNTNKLRIGFAGFVFKSRITITELLSNTHFNLVDQTIIADDVISNVTINGGNNNEVVTVLNSNKGKSDITIAGAYNRSEIEQTDIAGANGFVFRNSIIGNFNSVLTQQAGTNDSTVDVKITGNNNTITVHASTGSAVFTPRFAVPR